MLTVLVLIENAGDWSMRDSDDELFTDSYQSHD
ncbi:hypothetical protein S1OALGB6SA_923 [Olavius algarvensis spirochete endosymbiont]|nr:hypothetical protein S1OALGB6SA_923 [Olavius algarvensis spirochete endosymbiont]